MTDGAHRRTSWGDEDVEGVLREFFEREMPAELRRRRTDVAARGSGAVAPALPVATGRGGWIGRGAAPGLAAAALVLMASASAVFFGGSRRNALEPTPVVSEIATSEQGPPASDEPDDVVPIVVEVVPPDDRSPVFVVHERRDTADGPVELRIEKRTEKVEYLDPETGAAIEMEFPEFEIEVYPIEER